MSTIVSADVFVRCQICIYLLDHMHVEFKWPRLLSFFSYN